MKNLENNRHFQAPSAKSTLENDFNRRIGHYYLQRFSRFKAFRQAYSCYQNHVQSWNPDHYIQQLNMLEQTLFPNLEVDELVNELKTNSVAYGLQLPDHITSEILDFATHTPAREPHFDDVFVPQDLQNSRLSNGRYVLRGLVSNVMDCPAIKQLVSDPLLLTIVSKYLNYWPTVITQHLTWSFVSDLTDAEIQKTYPATNFHYDIAGYNFMTSYFYITDVNLDSEPHIMIKNSRDQKPLRMLFSSGRQTDDAVYKYYGRDSEIIITGKSGFGFMQDPSCIHKVKPPTTHHRLLLQIRYS